jgi:hypothetical protein
MSREFSRYIFEKKLKYQTNHNLSNRAELFHADGQTDMTNLVVTFGNFANASKK